MHFDEPEPQHQQQDQQQDQQQLSRALSLLDSAASHEQAAASFSVPVIELSSDLSPGVGPSLIDGAVADGNSSLRVKFKNKVNNTLASMKSSSNLRDKAKAQSAANSLAEPTSLSSTNSERRQSAYVISPTDLSQQDANAGAGKSNRQSKAFWTFPRVRHESNQQASKQVPWMGDANTTATVTDSHRQLNAAADATMQATEHGPAATDEPLTLSQQLQALKVEETQDQQQQLTFDSDHSLDIIQPVDYEDYTQFAELPLKKRKKMERSLAAANAKSGGRKANSMRAGAGAMKRLLTKQQQQDREIYTINGNKKRPQIPAEMTEGVSKQTGQHSEWRRSLLKSLHIGKGEQSSRKAAKARESNPGRALSPTPLGAIAESSTERQQQPSTAGPSHTHSSRHMRSGSVQSTRSLSLATSTHPALLATTIPKPRTPGLRRETLEMAMRRRRQSSVARSNISDTDIPPPLPLSSGFFGMENISTTNITHTFTSFTLELAELYAQDVVNNSAVPGLFNFKQQPPQPRASRMTVSSHTMMDMDTDQEFRGFDSDGDAISGYTGDADVSMEEIQVGSHTPKSPSSPTSATMLSATSQHLEAREPGMVAPSPSRRKISSVDGESDTVPELPTLMIRTRDLNNRNNYSRSGRPLSGSSFEIENDQSPRSPRRSHGGSISPTMSRKGGRGMMASPTSPSGSRQAGSMSSPTRSSRPPLSMEDIVSWKPRNTSQSSSRPQVPALVTKPLRPAKSSAYSPILTQSPGMVSPTERGSFNRLHHYQQSTSSSSSSSQYPHHQHQTSADTLVSTHPRYGSNISAGSGYSAQTLTGGVGGDYHQRLHQQYSSGGGAPLGAREFDPREEFPPTTPADLKAMDFEALLLTAEMEQQKGWEDLMAQKRSSALDTTLATSSIVAPAPSKGMANFPAMSMPPSGAFQRQPSVQPLKINTSAASKNNRSGQQQQQQAHQRSSVAFDLGPSDDGGTGTNTGTGTGSDRSLRSKRVMKKKMSVIRLAGSGNGNVQGRRENDGLIRVSVSPTPYASAPTPTPPSDFGTAGW
ncbi:hypothetical protein BGZ98_008994 [Dissophora globulifera]|nr:hypothetical protein BGZ98_008994 [Dissophora globulifera]